MNSRKISSPETRPCSCELQVSCLDVINRFYDRVMADEPLTRPEAAVVYRSAIAVHDNFDRVDAPLRPALADLTRLCKAKLKGRLGNGNGVAPAPRRV
jgi:hypothetical protein